MSCHVGYGEGRKWAVLSRWVLGGAYICWSAWYDNQTFIKIKCKTKGQGAIETQVKYVSNFPIAIQLFNLTRYLQKFAWHLNPHYSINLPLEPVQGQRLNIILVLIFSNFFDLRKIFTVDDFPPLNKKPVGLCELCDHTQYSPASCLMHAA